MREKLTGLYAITDAKQDDPQKLIIDVEQVLLGGARIIQFRDKSSDGQLRYKTASELRQLTQKHDALLIINDDVLLAKASHADGVHLGCDDESITAARGQLGPDAIIGVSCYNDFSLAEQAVRRGASYIAFGRFFPSRTKPNAIQAEAKILEAAKRELDIPVVAIGGITTLNGGDLIKAGADMLAVIDNIFSQQDIQAVANRYQKLFLENQL